MACLYGQGNVVSIRSQALVTELCIKNGQKGHVVGWDAKLGPSGQQILGQGTGVCGCYYINKIKREKKRKKKLSYLILYM